jgi:ATP:corrinoid adenosyltransferase
MTNTEHIYTPQDNSLSERIRAYCTVREAYLNAEASLKFLDDDEWADRLGDRKDVEKAYEISVRSLHMATEAITQDELHQAQEQGLLNSDEVREFIQDKRQQEMQTIRSNRQAPHSSTHRHS